MCTDVLAQVVQELQVRCAGSTMPSQEACNLLWGLSALDQLERKHLQQVVDQLAASGAMEKLTVPEAMQLYQVCYSKESLDVSKACKAFCACFDRQDSWQP